MTEEKPKSADEANEQFLKQAAKQNTTVVIFHNIDNESFTHSYDGIPWTVEAGEKVPLQFPIAKTLAKHLAMRIIRKGLLMKKKIGKGWQEKPIVMYTPGEMNEVMDKIMFKTIEKPAPGNMSKTEVARIEHAKLKEEFGDQLRPDPQVTKRDVIAELTKRGIKHDPRASFEDLSAKLIEDEKNQQ